MGFPRQEPWSGLPFPSPEDLPHSGIEFVSLASPALASRFSTTVPQGKLQYGHVCVCVCMHTCSVAELCPTLCNPMDSSLPVSSVHGIFQARILE